MFDAFPKVPIDKVFLYANDVFDDERSEWRTIPERWTASLHMEREVSRMG
jgi:hypothetical protein